MQNSIIITLLATLPVLVYLGVATYLQLRSTDQFIKEGNQQLRQHLMAMDAYSRETNRLQAKWFKELGYTGRQIFERIDGPEEED